MRMQGLHYRSEIARYPLPAQLRAELVELFSKHNHEPARRRSTTANLSTDTWYKRFVNICSSFVELQDLGYPIQSVSNLREKHVLALVQHWQAKAQNVGTIANKLTYLRTLAGWIGKHGMVKSGSVYSATPAEFRRAGAATRDKSWEGNGIDPLEVIQRVRYFDHIVGMQLELQFLFGVRMKEACLLRPALALKQALATGKVFLEHGTKGGRPRELVVENVVQIEVLTRAAALAVSLNGTMIPRSYTYAGWANHYFYIVGRRAGLTKAEHNTTGHGARHSFCQRKFAAITGKPAPIQGGGDYDPELLELAMREVVEAAGHSRPEKSQAYVGAILASTSSNRNNGTRTAASSQQAGQAGEE